MDYYTYAYLREDGSPYYIGKGRGRRAYRSDCKSAKVPKNRDRVIFLKKDLTEEEAFIHEIYMIAVLGRLDNNTGILRNLTDGGEGFSSKKMKEIWERRRAAKKAAEWKTWREENDTAAAWREKNEALFTDLIQSVLR